VAEALAKPPLLWSVGVTDYRLETYIASTKSRRRRKKKGTVTTAEDDETVTPKRKKRTNERRLTVYSRTAGRTAGDTTEMINLADQEEESEDLGPQRKKQKGEKEYVTYGDGEYVFLIDGADEKVAEMKVKTGQPSPPGKDHANYKKSLVPGAYVEITSGNKFKLLSRPGAGIPKNWGAHLRQ
jgi:hypothetical protein